MEASEVERIFRAERARVFAALVRVTRDIEVAEDALQDAFLAALDVWPREGLPRSPAAWLTTVGRNRALSIRRHEGVVADAREAILERLDARPPTDGDDIPDERLALIFCACHPALSEEARIALTLQVMCGLSTTAIGRLFLAPEATVAQRLVRSKRKIREAGVPFAIPSAEHLEERLEGVLAVVYLLFTEGHSPSDGDIARSAQLCEEALRLARVLCSLLPTHAEVRGLLALMLLHDARRAARVDRDGELVPLEEQDRALWDRDAIAEGERHLHEALERGRAGPYQVQAAIAALHATAARASETDWAQIMALYEDLWRRWPAPGVAVSLAIAEGMAFSPDEGLARLDRFERDGALRGFDRVSAARADLLRRAGRVEEARAAYASAIAGARNERERRALERKAGIAATARASHMQ
jgi:RNA polymerase sigma-70 factor (ECF subfamily)